MFQSCAAFGVMLCRHEKFNIIFRVTHSEICSTVNENLERMFEVEEEVRNPDMAVEEQEGMRS